ncbi:hypothetical protein K9M74_01670 [Candidatus Woesearchaeota archaeon]|nr:hypothetical protein [Candidatus Woesearchaeota archaeon]
MKFEEAYALEPGDKIIFVPPQHIKFGIGPQESSCHTPTQGVLFAGDEYIVSFLAGYSKENKIVFENTFKEGMEIFALDVHIASLGLYLENFDEPVNYKFFEKQRPLHLESSIYDMENFIDTIENNLIPGNDYLTAIIDHDALDSLYYLKIDKYLNYLDIEINTANKVDFDSFERSITAYNQKENKPSKESDNNELYGLFLRRQQEKKNFFQGTKNICSILQKEHDINYYGEIIELFRNRSVSISEIIKFYEEGWLGKKEFQIAVMKGYNQLYPVAAFKEYKW